MKLAVLGAGIQARAIVDDFVRHAPVDEIGVADIDGERAASLARSAGDDRVKPHDLDVADRAAVVRWLRPFDAVVSAVPYRYNADVARAAVESATHFTDLGGNNDVVAEELALDEAAREAGVAIVPDLGLAPGMIPILAAGLVKQVGPPRSLHIRVGGLPQKPPWPLGYRLFFAVEGLVNEYVEPCRIIRNGCVETVAPLSELEEITFPKPFGVLEAFQTSGGTSTLVDTLLGEVEELTYKTIRYPGHCRDIRLLQSLGFFEERSLDVCGQRVVPRRFTEMLLSRRLTEPMPDVVLARIVVEGTEGDGFVRIVEELVDRPDDTRGLSAMARCTGYPAAIVAAMLATGEIDVRGAVPAERAVPEVPFRAALARRELLLMRRVIRLDGAPA